MLDFESLNITPKTFAKMCNTSVSKVMKGVVPKDQLQSALSMLDDIQSMLREEPEVWLSTNLPIADVEVTPLQLMKYNPSVSALINNPEAEFDRVCPKHGRLMFRAKGVSVRDVM